MLLPMDGKILKTAQIIYQGLAVPTIFKGINNFGHFHIEGKQSKNNNHVCIKMTIIF